MTPVEVTDPADPRLDDYRRLRDPAHRARVEREQGFFVCEGITVVRRLLTSPLAARSVLVDHRKLPRVADLAAARGVPVYVASRDVLRNTAGFDIHRGVVAAADRPPHRRMEDVAVDASSLVVAEGIGDHVNLGSIFRSAAALGAGGMLLDPRCADPWYRRSVRVSMGAVLSLPFATVPDWPAGLTRLREAGFFVVALTPDPSAPALGEVGPPTGRRPALLVGAEGPGLSDDALAAADTPARIPMAGAVDSLNVAHAVTAALYHALVLGFPTASGG